MSNTFAPGAIAQTLSRVGTTVLQDCLASLKSFCTVLEIMPPDPPALASQVAIATVASTTQILSRAQVPDYQTSNCTLSNVALSPRLFVQPFGLSNDDQQGGTKLEWLAELNARQLAAAITDAVAALLTVGNYGAAISTASAANFGANDFDTLLAGVASPNRAVLLDSPYWVKVKSTWLPPNFSNVMEMNRWSAAGSNVRGMVCDPRAIVVRNGVPMVSKLAPPVLARELIELPSLGLVAECGVHVAPGTRAVFAAYSLYFGAAVGDPAALKLLSSG